MKDYVTTEGAMRPERPLDEKKSLGIACQMCGEHLTTDDFKEFREMGEEYHREKGCFFCPDCWDAFQRLPLERQAEILIKGACCDD